MVKKATVYALFIILAGCAVVQDLQFEEAKENGNILAIIGGGSYAPNSAGGVDVSIEFKNLSDKTIKYITFKVVPYNAVDDVVECEIRGISERLLKATGPIAANDVRSDMVWQDVWYNTTIKRCTAVVYKIIYMDGSSLERPNNIFWVK